MKKLFAAVAACFALSAHAAGPWDGIYECAVSGGQGVYVALNGHPDGVTFFTVVALSSDQRFFGFGGGIVANGQFAGNTNYNLPFSLRQGGQGLTGTVGTVVDGRAVTATVDCKQIW